MDPKSPDANRDAKSILLPDYTLNEQLYKMQGPFYITQHFAVNYFTSFINIAAVVAHVIIWHGNDIMKQIKQIFNKKGLGTGFNDIHNNLINVYPDLHEYHYAVYLAILSVLTIIVCTYTPFEMPWWASILALLMGIVLTLPIGIVYAITGTQIGINVITEYVIGLLIPGRTVAVVVFKSLGYNVMIQALNLAQDLKVGHYMHISPLSILLVQFIGTFIGIIINTGGAFFVMSMKSPEIFINENWLATGYNTFLSAAGIWGAIGPRRFFGIGSPYENLLSGFGIGLFLPVIPWALNRIRPHPYWKLSTKSLLINSPHPPFDNRI